jgi:hypothetical protein
MSLGATTPGSTDAQRRRRWATNLCIAVIGLILFAALNTRSGRLDANDGLGWDGRQYAHMVTNRLQDGTVATQTRPLLPLLTRIPYYAGLDIISAFQVMNFVYAAVLYIFLCLLLDTYEVPSVYKAYLVVTIALCIATSKMFAFYPTVIDLGALAVLSAATYVVLTRGGWAAGIATLLAVLSREFGVALAFFGMHRELREGRGLVRALLTYAPAVAAMFALRRWAYATNLGDPDRAMVTTGDFIANLALWRDPAFVSFFAYFLFTLVGGVTLLLALKPAWSIRRLAATPELATFAAVIMAATAVGNADIWRYLVFLLPVITILFACYVRDHQPGALVLSTALLFTLATQQPFTQMDVARYFRDWFPVYVTRTADATPEFWSLWRVRLVMTGAVALALGFVQWKMLRWNARWPQFIRPSSGPSQPRRPSSSP